MSTEMKVDDELEEVPGFLVAWAVSQQDETYPGDLWSVWYSYLLRHGTKAHRKLW